MELLAQHSSKSDPMDNELDYAEAYEQLDYAAPKKDLAALMTDAQRRDVSHRRRSGRWR